MHQATPPVYQGKNCLQPACKFIGLQSPHNFLDQAYFMTIGSLVLRSKGGSDLKKYEMDLQASCKQFLSVYQVHFFYE
jgi:hypothetical protein